MMKADSLSVSPLWLHEVHIAKTAQVAQWAALCVNGCRQTVSTVRLVGLFVRPRRNVLNTL